MVSLGWTATLGAQAVDSSGAAGKLKRLSLEELMDIEVTSVSRRAERLSETASAVQVLTAEDIRRSGAATLPEALRLAANLQVAQANASQWAISARGFNNVLANKLLVLIDGRTVYTPLYAGVFWDAQAPPLDLIDRIEIISGPGGDLWGANAVNGVINVITKAAGETPGLAFEGGGGTELQGFGTLRYGGRLSPSVQARVYGEGFAYDGTDLVDDGDAGDSWHLVQGGFRIDGTSGQNDRLSLQGDVYDGRPNPDGKTAVVTRGGNAVGRWVHTISPTSQFQLQVYYDRTFRDFKNGFTEDLATYDVDWQHRLPLGSRQDVIWGFNVRLMDHTTENLPLFTFTPSHKLLHLYSLFLHDEIALVPDRLRLTIGSKFEHNDYTGMEIQPSARLAWSPGRRTTLWGAVSRAVRTPVRLDRDFELDLAPGLPLIAGGDLESESVIAYETGWRWQTAEGFALSLSTFYNEYDHLRSAEPGPAPLGIPITFANGVRGHTYGAEIAASGQVTPRWRLRGGYTFLKKDLSLRPGSADLNKASAESNDPEHQVILQSMADLTGRLEWDVVFRYIGDLPSPEVPDYVGLDMRLGWRLTPRLELSVVGQNLLKTVHREFTPSSPSARAIERGIYGKVTWR